MLFNLDLSSTTILSSLFYFFLIIEFYFLIPAVIAQIFNPFAELVSLLEIPTKEAEAETHSVIAEAKIRKCSI